MIVSLKVKRVEKVVCNRYQIDVEPGALAAMLAEIRPDELKEILNQVTQFYNNIKH